MKHTLVEATEGRKTIPNVDDQVHETYVETEQTVPQVEFRSSPVKCLFGPLIEIVKKGID